MTAPDTAAIRGQMTALSGFTPGPWGNAGDYYVRKDAGPIAEMRYASARGGSNARLIAAAPDMHATILALCDALDAARLCVSHANLHADCAIADMTALRAENERLREAAEHFATWDQCWPGNINLEGACEKIRAALAQKGGE